MNKQLKELWDKSKTSGVHPKFGEYDMYSAERFAELIINECIGFFENINDREDAVAMLRVHFGVEK